ncbi:MAG: hypothetical protein HYR55_10245, partial [Acidobacteria bacterium]|nr:hypothetical protein [Acidobacteriota bacterium]MBI3658604.1 hypothetical protein [Acidobacteriota bacterium]
APGLFHLSCVQRPKAKHSLDLSGSALPALGVHRSEVTPNGSAVKSLEEGLEETLTLHRLGLFKELGTSFKTTNCIESLNRQVGIYTDRVSYWKNSNQRQRWLAAACVEIEPRLRKVKGHRHLKALRQAMHELNTAKARRKAA